MKILKYMVFRLILAPLIRRDYRLRKLGEKPDQWYWADKIAWRWGYVINPLTGKEM